MRLRSAFALSIACTVLSIAVLVAPPSARPEGLDAERLGVLYNLDDPSSEPIARLYASDRSIPGLNLVGVHLGREGRLRPEGFAAVRRNAIDRLPGMVQSLALVWSLPFAVGCMSITTAMAAGYRASFCEPGCADTEHSPLYGTDGWLPADTVGWLPSMLLPTDDKALALALIRRGIASDGSSPRGTLYLDRTQDSRRNVRAGTYAEVESALGPSIRISELSAPFAGEASGAIGYFTGSARVEELPHVHFLPGAVADHLTSSGGVLVGGTQTTVLAWLAQGATASYGEVSEPCNNLGKFPDIGVLMRHYLRGETVLEAYWKSVRMPGQGLFVGEPLARPYASR